MTTTSMLEQRRREARAFDEVQRKAEERATQVRLTEKPRVAPAHPAQEPKSGEDVLAALLVRDERHIVTTADLRSVVEWFDEQIADLRAEIETAETA